MATPEAWRDIRNQFLLIGSRSARPIRVRYRPEGWGVAIVTGEQTGPWTIDGGTPESLQAFLVMARAATRALGHEGSEDHWLDRMREHGLCVPDTAHDAPACVIPDVCQASADYAAVLAIAPPATAEPVLAGRPARETAIESRSILSQNLTALRKQLRLSVDQLTNHVGIGREAIMRHANDQATPEGESLAGYASAFSKLFGVRIEIADLYEPNLVARVAADTAPKASAQ